MGARSRVLYRDTRSCVFESGRLRCGPPLCIRRELVTAIYLKSKRRCACSECWRCKGVPHRSRARFRALGPLKPRGARVVRAPQPASLTSPRLRVRPRAILCGSPIVTTGLTISSWRTEVGPRSFSAGAVARRVWCAELRCPAPDAREKKLRSYSRSEGENDTDAEWSVLRCASLGCACTLAHNAAAHELASWCLPNACGDVCAMSSAGLVSMSARRGSSEWLVGALGCA